MVKSNKVLIVDDDPDILEALQIIFESEGYATATITKGDETYVMVDSFHPDVIILDVLLSGRDGRTICKNLKENVVTKQIPVLMMSAHPGANISTLAVGANDFLAKPFDTVDLLERVKKLL